MLYILCATVLNRIFVGTESCTPPLDHRRGILWQRFVRMIHKLQSLVVSAYCEVNSEQIFVKSLHSPNCSKRFQKRLQISLLCFSQFPWYAYNWMSLFQHLSKTFLRCICYESRSELHRKWTTYGFRCYDRNERSQSLLMLFCPYKLIAQNKFKEWVCSPSNSGNELWIILYSANNRT